jgi:DNA polymerase-3 subunit alpha (Gram-positive type)
MRQNLNIKQNAFLNDMANIVGCEWPNDLYVEKTVVYRKSKRLDIYLSAVKRIGAQDIVALESYLKRRLSGAHQIRVWIQYKDGLDCLKENLKEFWKDIVENIKRDEPSCAGWMEYCKCRLDEEGLKIRIFDKTAFKFLRKKKINYHIKKWIERSFKNTLEVFLIEDANSLSSDNEEYLANKESETSSLIKDLDISYVKQANATNTQQSKVRKESYGNVILGKRFKDEPTAISCLNEESGRVTVEGMVFGLESREIRGAKVIFCMDITDYTGSITAKTFCDKTRGDALKQSVYTGQWLRIRGNCQYDKYQKEIVLMFDDIITIPPKQREDTMEEKRVELHLHTQMSAMDAVASVKDLINRAASWGHPAIAITDHGVVQAFPEAYTVAKKAGIKAIFGVEAYLINDCKPLVYNSNDNDFNQSFTVLDIETTGLDERLNEITEIGAVKIKDKRIIDSFHTFVNPGIPIPSEITKLTGITDDMVKDAPPIEEALKAFKNFFGEDVLVAHNASFDLGFIKTKAKKIGLEIDNPVVDTLGLCRELLPDLKRYRLDTVAKYLGVPLKRHHSALDDATATGGILISLIEILERDKKVEKLSDINSAFSQVSNLDGLENFHAVILAKNPVGLRNLYILISEAHLKFFYRKPRIPKSLLMKYREGLIVGSGCESGELYRALLKGVPFSEVQEIVRFYDYLEIQPLGNNDFLLRDGQVSSIQQLQKINHKIVELGARFNKLVVATGDVHFLDPQDEYFRRILMSGQGYEDADQQAPLYFKTTGEMLDEFQYLGSDTAKNVVIHNPRIIADQVEELKPIPDKLYPPEIPGAEEEVVSMAMKKAISIYGDPLPPIVQKRLKRELDSITSNGYAVLYLIAHKLVKKSLNDGYLVGSRGSVGSSLAATMMDITEVNPLPPHYICPNCKYSDFNIDIEKYGCGVDLPDQNCPACGTVFRKDGMDIPFEVFLGFKGDKIPDIDLNFSGDYQPIAHKYTEELFGQGYVFRAGTIGTIAEKTAFGFVKKYLEEKDMVVSNAEIKRLVSGCTGVKRTTGQHPGGILVVPKTKEIYEFTPIQYPADAKESGTITSHFDFNSIQDTLVKLDILGHDDPTVIKMLEDLTGVNAKDIPLDEKNTMALFSSTDPLGVKPEDIGSQVGTYGIPEFGTDFVRQMLVDTKPTTFSELLRISGLSHGTNVWLNNAQDLIKSGTATLTNVICTRDDIMSYLIHKGVEATIAFKIMESVRKGKGLTDEFEMKMKEQNIPEWYIDSCNKIQYLFPKAHAAAYVIMAFRIAYFKVYYPEAFYAAYFTVRADDFDAACIIGGKEIVLKKISEIQAKGNEASTKESNLLKILEVALEMYCRGLKFASIDLYNSDAVKFLITDKGIRPPLNSLQGLGINAAKSIVEARELGQFVSVEDLRQRTRVSKTVIDILKSSAVIEDLPETSQISFF